MPLAQCRLGRARVAGSRCRWETPPPPRNCARPAHACALPAWRPPSSLGRGGLLSQPPTSSLMHLAMEGGHSTRARGSVHCRARLRPALGQLQGDRQPTMRDTTSAMRDARPRSHCGSRCAVSSSLDPSRGATVTSGRPTPHLKIASQHRAECKSKAPGGPSYIKVLIHVYFFLGFVLGEHDKNAAAPCISQGHGHF